MQPPLMGRRVALLEARMSEDAADLVRRMGGIPFCAPAVREALHLEQVPWFIKRLSSGSLSVVVLLTGAGAAALLREADRLGFLEQTLTALRLTTNACRGPKPSAVLTRHDVPVHISAAEPYTTTELLDALRHLDLDGKAVALVHYGEPNDALAAALRARGARLEELCLYEWVMPDDVGPLKALVRELIDRHVDAVAFTSQIQCRHLFRIAADLGLSDQLAQAMNSHAVVAVVGPVCARALQALGVTPDVIPARPKMAPMIAALAEYFELTEGLSEK